MAGRESMYAVFILAGATALASVAEAAYRNLIKQIIKLNRYCMNKWQQFIVKIT